MKPEQKVVEYHLELEEGGDTSTITREEVSLYPGICTLIEVVFPPGPAGLVGVRALQGLHQLIPESNKLWLTGDDTTYPHGSPVDLITGSKILRVEGYNTDETYSHTIIFRFTVAIPTIDSVALLTEVLKERIPTEIPFYIKALPEILAEASETKLILKDFVLPILDAMNKRDEDRWRAEIRSKPIEELMRL